MGHEREHTNAAKRWAEFHGARTSSPRDTEGNAYGGETALPRPGPGRTLVALLSPETQHLHRSPGFQLIAGEMQHISRDRRPSILSHGTLTSSSETGDNSALPSQAWGQFKGLLCIKHSAQNPHRC